MVGDNAGMADSEKCLNIYKKQNFELIKTKKIPDFLIYFVKYQK
jgi:hypothetical protein